MDTQNIAIFCMCDEVLDGATGWVLADCNYWSPDLMVDLKAHGIWLVVPYKKASGEKHPWPRKLTHIRFRIETVFSQLTDLFHAKKMWVRDAWRLISCWLVKI